MALIDVQADTSEVARQLKRIADLLEDYIYPKVAERAMASEKATVTRVDVRSRWEAEREAGRLQGLDEVSASVRPRR